MIEYKGYTGVFEFDSELEFFSGFIVDLRDQIYFEGKSVEELKASMVRAVDHYLEVCAARGEEPDRPFSGRLHVRLGTELHRFVAVAAARRGQSINSWLIHVLTAASQHDPKVVPLMPREKRGGKRSPRGSSSVKKKVAASKE